MNALHLTLTPCASRYFKMDAADAKKNLSKTLELIDLCFKLKESYLMQQHPQATTEEIRELIYQDILKRKERQWTSPRTF
jgi:hypothetical protein